MQSVHDFEFILFSCTMINSLTIASLLAQLTGVKLAGSVE